MDNDIIKVSSPYFKENKNVYESIILVMVYSEKMELILIFSKVI